MTPRLLMCPPDYYEVAYEINPWMSVRRNVNRDLARRQWEKLYETLVKNLGVAVDLIQPVEGLPDMVFTANAGLVYKNTFIRSNFRHKERAPEALFFEKWFEEKGFTVVRLPKSYFFEGEGDAFLLGETLFAGYHFRSDIHSHQFIAETLSKRALSLELLDERFYHLDTCFCPLSDDTALYYPQAFDDYALRLIQTYLPNTITIRLQEALHFGCNSIGIHSNIILPAECTQTAENLRFLGYRVFKVELSEFLKAGGSAKCLVLRTG